MRECFGVCECSRHGCSDQFNRRAFLRAAGLGGAIASWFWLTGKPVLAADYQARALVLSCIDFRFITFEQSFLESQNLKQAYDWVALAGASLALTGFPHAAEAEAFWDQLALSKKIHQISKVIILDHQDCGAYASKFEIMPKDDLEAEQQIHTQYLNQAYQQVKQHHPELIIELYFMLLNGEARPVLPEV